MTSINDQIWLTYALSDATVGDALTLSYSLKNVMTSHKLGVIISSKVSRLLREALVYGFDYVFYLDEEGNPTGLENEEYVKLFALTLKSFERCVMLSPKMLVVNNCDELFDRDHDHDSSQVFVCAENGDASILLISPSLHSFKEVMKGIPNVGDSELHPYLKKWITNQNPRCNFIDSKYNRKICVLTGGMLFQSESDVAIVNMNDAENLFPENFGYVEKKIIELWKRIRNDAIQFLDSLQSPSLEMGLGRRETSKREAIAIIGMSCRYPSSNNLDEFWQILVEGKDGTGNPPEFRWRREQCSRNKPESIKTNAGFLKCPVDDFDSRFFNISPKEMVCMDPQFRLLHELVWEGLEDAAINPQSLEGTNGGVFIGSWLNDYKDILSFSGTDEFYRVYMGNSIGAGAARISHLLGLTGPSIATESGCSSAMVAVHLACKSLLRRESSMALACGVNLLLHPFDKDEMPMVVSPEGRCKTFDAKADGFARGEGGGVLVLKRLSDAVRDRDKIWALIKGSGMSQEGVSKSMGTPTVHCESLAMKNALRDAKVAPERVTYVEAHGTGTTVGDPMEVKAIAKAYHSKERKEPLLIGSVKTNVGHTESCSGITGIMKVVLGLHNEIIPPHRNFESLNPAIDLETIPARIPLEPVKWPKQHGISRMAGVSSFGITGTDAHAIIEEAPTLPPNILADAEVQRPLHIMTISAKTDEALDILLNDYKNELVKSEDYFKDMAFTANAGRADFSQRVVIIAKSKEDALKSIEQNQIMRGEEVPEGVGKVCYLFTGQGSQYPGMAKQLYETSPVFRMHFEHCVNILKNDYNIDITKVLWSSDKSSDISRTIYSQTSIFCVEYALLKLWESWGVKADYALGHSLGEFAAAVCAGILNVEDALKLVAERSRLIDELPHGKMLVIKAEKQRVDSLMNKFAGNEKNKILEYAAVNAVEQTVVAGDSDVVMQFAVCCKEANLKCIMLEATHAFHSKHMDPMLNAYRKVAETAEKLEGNNCKYISGMRGSCVNAEDFNAEYWVEHTRNKVNFLDASKVAVNLGCKTFIEIGPQPILSALTMINNDRELLCLPSLRKNENEWETLLNTLGKLYLKGVEIDWKGVDQFYERKKVRLPHYPFIKKKYWPDLLSSTTSTIHPLLGSPIENASPTKLFQNGLNLRTIEYLKDHVIGDNIIFPGACYLEMCLAAGLATVEGPTQTLAGPSTAIKVENLIIQAPLCLDESKTTLVQTVVELNTSENEGDWNDMKVSIFRRMVMESSSKWLPHAQATFSPVPTAQEKNVTFDPQVFTQTIEMPSTPEFTEEIYSKLSSLGLKFGPCFKSLEKVWRDEKSKTIIAKVKLPTGNEKENRYVLHPILLDSMILIMMLREAENFKRKLYLPINIGNFVWHSGTELNEFYIHSETRASPEEREGKALLVDSTGKILASMSSVEFIETTVKAIEAVIEQQSSSMPDMWEEVWKSQVGPFQHAVDLKWGIKESFFTEEFEEMMERYNHPSPEVAETFREVEILSYFHMLKALYESGWNPEVGQIFDEDVLAQELQIQKNFKQYFGFILDTLKGEGILERMEKEGSWRVSRDPPSLQKVVAALQTAPLYVGISQERFKPAQTHRKFGENLLGILRGEQSPLTFLFPDDPEKGTAGDFYQDYGLSFKVTESSSLSKRRRLAHLREGMKGQRFILRILEVGAGTGSYTEDILTCLEEEEIEFEYCYTDISPGFFPAAEKRFEKYGKQMKFKKLNIEEDPLDQGFIPQYFDIVYASEVIHATRNIRESLRNLRVLMKPYGKLDMHEGTRQNVTITFAFGVTEGYWRFNDFDLRPRHCSLSAESWAFVLEQCGFKVDKIFPILNNHHSHIHAYREPDFERGIKIKIPKRWDKTWLLFQEEGTQISHFLKGKIEALPGRKVTIVTTGTEFERNGETFQIGGTKEEGFQALFGAVETTKLEGIIYCWGMNKEITTQDEILQPYFYLVKTLLSLNLSNNPKIIGITSGSVVPLEQNNLSHFHASTLWGFTKSLSSEHTELNCKCIELADGEVNEAQMEQIFYEIWQSDKEIQVAYSGASRYIPRFIPYKPLNNALKLPKGTNKFCLILPSTKSIGDLQFGPLELGNLKEDHVEIQVKASALNFRDLLSVIKPSDEFKNSNGVGFDFAGVVKRVGEKVTRWKVGDRVFGCNTHLTPFPSHIQLKEVVVLKVPENMSFCDAATLPTVYMTSIKCLLEVAKIRKEDVVLIHTASGGLGLSAIELCKHVGCKIIATTGSLRKQNYLRSLGIQQVFHSRNTEFGEKILEITEGKGVDVVLNSLTSQGFKEATLKACGKGARFIEMSRLNIWKVEEVKELRPDVEYSTVDISASDEQELRRLLRQVTKLMEKNEVKPIPYVRFDGLNVREALEYLKKAKHIGKIVCVMPELRNGGGEMKVFTNIFNDRSTYLITGGLGGIGFVVCKWMLEKGAKHVILANRNEPNEVIQKVINELNLKGANLIPVKLDVGNFEQLKKLIKTQIVEMGLPPLRGVMHAAGTLSDGLIVNQEWSKLSSTFTTKIDGTLNLHELTKHLNLEHFVMFSSLASIFGPPSQCNHAAGNCFEDAIVQYRNSIGLPATSVNWGQWGEVGVATEVDLPGVKALSNLQGVTGLEHVMKTHRTQTCILNVDSFPLLCKRLPYLSAYLDERLWKKSLGATSSLLIKSEEFWQQYDSFSCEKKEEKLCLLKDKLRAILRTILRLDENEIINDEGNFQEMGVDSLMFVEIKNALQSLLGERVKVNATALKDCSSVNVLAQTLMNLIEGNNVVEETKPPTMEEVNELIREDCILPENIRAKPGQKIGSVREIKRVLLTGCTGTLGSYVLKELSNMSEITKVICLMRQSTNERGEEERLKNILRNKELLPKVDMTKVTCVTGNVEQSHIGMDLNTWEKLAESVDAVVNCSARVQHAEHYRKIPGRQNDVRGVNIGGMKNLLEFACEKKLKHFCHVSSLLSVLKTDGDNRISETWPNVEDYDGATTFAYPISKFVSDFLAKEAVERGIPCKVIRLPLISGESGTGRCSPETSHALLRYMFIMKNGIMSSTPLPAIALPVDTCAQLTVRLFFDERAVPDVYNVGKKKADLDQEFVNVASKFGYKVELVELAEFIERVKMDVAEKDNSALAYFKEVYKNEDALMSSYYKAPVLQQWLDGNEEIFMSKKVLAIIPNVYENQLPSTDYIYNDLLYAKGQGWFTKFGL